MAAYDITIEQTTADKTTLQKVQGLAQNGQAVSIKAQVQGQTRVVLDGQPLNGDRYQGKALRLKKVGNNLLVQVEEDLVAQVVDFYSTEGATLLGDAWLPTEGLVTGASGLVLDPATAVEASSAVVSASAGLPGLSMPAVIAGVAGVAALSAGGSTTVASNKVPVVSSSLSLAVTEGGQTKAIDLLQGASDANGDTLSVSGLSYKVNGVASSALPAGLSLSADGKTLTLDPTSAAFTSLTANQTQTITISYSISDGKGGSVEQTAIFTITGVQADTITTAGQVTAGQSAAGLLVEVFDKDGKKVLGADGMPVTAHTDANGNYSLNIPKSYAGQALSLKVTDPDAFDGKGYIDEATGESKDFSSALRSTLVLTADKDQQTAQISPLTELAARKILNLDGSTTKTAQEVQDTNKAIAQLFGLTDIVDAAAPDVVGKGDGDATSNSYGQALALLSGMDAINERQGAADPMAATLARLDQAITISGGVSAQFSGSDTDTLNLLSQAVAEVATTNTDTSLIDALANIALDAAKTGLTGTETKTVFITSQANLLGAGKTTTVSFRFDGTPESADVDSLKAQLQISGGSLSDFKDSGTELSVYTATFTQSGSEAPKVWVTGSGFFSNELAMQLDTTAPALSVARIEGLGTDGLAKSILKAGDTVRVTLNADESVLVTGAPVLKLNVGNTVVEAVYDAAASGTRNLVFTYKIADSINDTDGVAVDSLSLGANVSIGDFAGNTAQLNSAYSGLSPVVDTLAPVVISQAPLDGSTVGNAAAQTLTLNFSEVVRLGAGTLTLKRGDATVQTLDIGAGALAADGQSVSFTLPAATLTAGSYTVTASTGGFVDAAGNAFSGDLATGGWDFTVGAVTLGINKVSVDNLLNATEASRTLALSGTLGGTEAVLQGINAADLQVWLKPAAGGSAVQATVKTLGSGAWTAELSESEAANLTGGYIVQVLINKADVKSSATSVIVVDRAAQMAWGRVAGDDAISLLEQSIVSSGKTIALPFAAEKGASGTVTLVNATDSKKTVTKNFSNATGTADAASLSLSAADLADLGTGTINLSAVVTDVAGNTATVAKTFSIAAPAEAAKVTAVQLSGSNTSTITTQALGDKVLASVTFDKALALSGSDLDLSLQVGSNTRTAKFVGLSADRRSLNFEYTVQTGDQDDNGVALAAASSSSALRLGAGVTLKDLSGSAALLSLPTNIQGLVKVDATATAEPDLAVSVVEAGLTVNGVVAPGTASVAGKLVTTNGETVRSVKFGENASDVQVPAGSTATSLGAAVVQGKFGTWRVGADGSYTYSLNNSDTDTQALAAGASSTDVLAFVSSAGTAPKQLTVTVSGSNDAPTVSSALTQAATEGSATASIDLLSGAVDPDANTTLSVSNITYKVGNGQTSPSLPDGLVLGADGKTLSLDPAHATFNSLKAGATQTITASFSVTDGQGGSVAQTATFTVIGSNDTPTVSSALTQAATEGSPATSINLLANAADVDGDTLSVSSITYKVGTGAASSSLPEGLVLIGGSVLSLDPTHSAFNSLKAGATQTITANYSVTDGQGGSVAQSATFTVTGTNDEPTVSAALTQAATEGSTANSINLLANAADVDGDTLSVSSITYKVGGAATSSTLPEGLSLGADGKTLSLDPANAAFSNLKAGATQTITASYNVTDGQGGSVPQTATFTVTGTNDAPTAVSSVAAQTAVKAQPYSLDVSSYFADVDAGDTRSYALSGAGAAGLSIDASGKITGTLTATRDAQDLTVTLTDGSGATASQTINLRVVDKPVVQSIALAQGQSTIVPGDSSVQLALTLSEAVTVSGEGVPTLTLSINGQSTTATYQSGSGSNTLVFSATVPSTDGNALSISAINLPTGTSITGNTSGQALLTTTVGQSTTALTIDSTAPQISATALNVAENATTVATLGATDATALTWTLAEGGTDNALFSLSEAGALTLKAAKDYETDKKTYSIQVQATDAAGNSSSQTLSVNLTDVNEAPTALTMTNATTSLAENASTTARIKVADIAVTDDALGTNTFSIDGADKAAFEVEGGALYLKAGTALDFETKASFSVTVRAQDTGVVGSQPVSQNFTLTISDVNEAPTVSAALTQAATEGSATASIDLLSGATDPDANTTLSVVDITYKVGTGEASSTLPAGLTLSGNTLTLDPANAAFNNLKAGATQTITASYNVTDGQGGSVAQTATFTVTGTNDAPVASVIAPPAVVVGQSYAGYTVPVFTDADGDDLTYTAKQSDGTDLPSWLGFDPATRSFSVSSTVGLTAQTLALKVTATDGTTSTDAAFNLAVTASPASTVTLSSTSSADKGIVAGLTSDTLHFKFSAPVDVDTLEAALASQLIQVKAADGSVRSLGAGASIEATYPSALSVAGFSTAADGAYTSLYDPSTQQNTNVPVFSGFSTNGAALSVDGNYPVYKHTDANSQSWYLWRPAGWSSYVLTPEAATHNGQAQTWWTSDSGAGMGTASNPREGVLTAGNWWVNSGALPASQSMWTSKLATTPTLDASDYAFTYTIALGAGHTVAQGDNVWIDKAVVKDSTGLSPASDLTLALPNDITRPSFGTATVKGLGYVNGNWTEKTTDLAAGDQVRVELAANENMGLYYTSGALPTVVLQLDNGLTRYATLDLSTLSYDNTNKRYNLAAGTPLRFTYTVQSGDVDTADGITVGGFNRNTVGFYDAAGNRVVPDSDLTENTNTLRILDNAAPGIWVSYASGTTLVLQASEALDTSHLPASTDFVVMVNGQAVVVNSVAAVPGNPNAVLLTLASAVTANQFVQVSYSDPTANNDTNALQDLAGNDVASVQSIGTNASTAPTIQYAQANVSQIELANGESELWFHVKYSDVVAIAGTPRLALILKDGTSTSTVYADYQPYQGVTNGQNTLSFMYKPTAGTQGQVHVSSIDLNGGSISAWGSAGTVQASTALTGSDFFTPYTWIYPSASTSLTGDAGNNLFTPWLQSPENTPKTLSTTTVNGGDGSRDVLVMSVLLPSSVQTGSAAMAYRLDYNVTTEGVRQVLLMNGSTVVDTYTLPANTDWPAGVEQIMFHAVYKDASNAVKFTDVGNLLLTKQVAEYVDAVDLNAIWLQGTLDADTLNMADRSVDQRIYIDAGQGDDTIIGHDGADLINGGGGTNTISAGLGNDTVMVRNGNQDLVDGGAGTDTLRFDLPGQEKKITVDAAGVIHVYSASGTWGDGFTPDANGWVERYQLSADQNSTAMLVFDVALNRYTTLAVNMEQLQWRLDDNVSGRATNKFVVGSAGNDDLSGADVVLAGAGDDTISLTGTELHTYDWRNGNRALLVDGGAGRDVLQLSTYVGGQLSQAFESSTGNNINASRVLQNIEGLNLTQGGYVQLAAADVAAMVGTNTNAWGSVISGLDSSKTQFLVTSSIGSTLNLSDSSGWTQKTSTVSYNNLTYKLLEHTSGIQLLLDSRAAATGTITYEGGPGGGTTTPPITLSTPVVKQVRSQDNQYVFPGDSGAHFIVEMSDAVRITGTPQLQLTLKSPDGSQTKAVQANFQRYGSTGDVVQTTIEFVYDYPTADAITAGWQLHIDSLSLNGGSITHSANTTVNANLALNRVAITAGDWLLGSGSVVMNSATGTVYNDVILPWESDPASAPNTLSASSTFNNVAINGGAGSRDVLGIPFMLPADVTTKEAASQYYLSFASNAEGTVRTVSLYKAGVSTAVKVFTVPNYSNINNINEWPVEIEAMVFYVQYHDAGANENRGVDGPGAFIELWKNGFTSTDPINGDVYKQGSFRSDTIDVSATAADKRVLIKAGYGSDTITGHAGVDVILGEGGSDTINAGDGDDLVWLSGGADVIHGGDGTDALGLHLHGAEARGWVDASHRLHIQSANGSWTNGQFVADATGYTSDWVLSFDQITGNIAAKRFAGGAEVNETSTATGIEALYFTFENNNQTGGRPLLRGTAVADTLHASQSQGGLMLGLDGNDTFVVDSSLRPFMMGGVGDDTFRLMSAGLTSSEGLQIHGGSGTDTLILGSDVAGITLYKPSYVNTQFTSLEMVDLTGSVANGAQGNTLQLTAAWIRESADLINGSRNLTVTGDVNDKISLLNAENWSLKTDSTQSGFAQYTTTFSNETLNVFVADVIKNASGGVILA